MLDFLTIILCTGLISSALILIKYMDFAKFLINRKDRKNRSVESKVVYFSHPKPFKKNNKSDIIIDIPAKDVKVLNNNN